MTSPIVVSADHVLVAVQRTIEAGLPRAIGLLEDAGHLARDRYGALKTLQQVPTAEALVAAQPPAIAFTSPGLAEPPSRTKSRGGWSATWRVAIGIYDRGKSHDDTAARVRDWCSLIRLVLLANPSLGVSFVEGLTWRGEEYASIRDRASARTIGAGACAVDVHVPCAVDLAAFRALPLPETGGPVVTSTTHTLTVKET